MVKYGKQYRELQIQEWSKHYIDYKLLKQKIKYLKTKLPRKEVSNILLNISNLNSMPLEPENNDITEDQYLSPLFILENGNYLKEFIDLLNEQFHKFYIFFSNTEKQLYKQINMHLYSKDNYKNLSKKNLKKELNSLGICIYLARCLNCFINDNLTALKKILKKFDKNFKNYFGLITPKYILSQISSSINDLDYIIQFKIIDEASCICEENAKILKKLYYEIGDNDNVNNEENKKNENNNEEEIKVDFMQLYNDLMLCVKEIDEIIDFKTQYKEWISFVKKGNKLIKNNPSLFENDIFNPLLSSMNYKDSLIEKFLSTNEAFAMLEKAQNQISISDKNSRNMNLILIHKLFYNSLVTCLLPNIIIFYESGSLSFVHIIIILFVSIISTFISLGFFKIPSTKYIILISYLIYFFGSLFHILSCDTFFDEFNNFYRFMILIISRIFIGAGSMEAVARNYIVIYSPKSYLIKISKRYSYINFFGYALGPLIMILLLLIPDIGDQQDIIVYNKKNSIGWYGIVLSFILFIINIIFFTKETGENFEMIKDQINLQIAINAEEEESGNKPKKNKKIFEKKGIGDKDIEKILEKNDILEGLIPEDKEKDIIINEEPKEEKKENEDKIIVKDEINTNMKEKEESKISDKIQINEEPKEIIDKSDNDINKKKDSQVNISILSNNIDTGMNSTPVLSLQQKKLINKLENKLDEFNEKSNFTNINLIPNNIDELIMKERNKFSYLNINLLIVFSLLFLTSLIKENMMFLFTFKLFETNKMKEGLICLILSGIFLFQIISFFFILPLKKINIFIKRYLLIFILATIIFISPLLYTPLLNEGIFVLTISVLGIITFSNIISVLISCYLSYLFPPRWNYRIGRSPIYVISAGKALGILICLFMKINFEFHFYFVFSLCVLLYGCIFVFLLIYKDFRIKIIARIIRKKALEDKGI